MKHLHPVSIGALRTLRAGLAAMEHEIGCAESAAEATQLYDALEDVFNESDRLSLLALKRAEVLCERRTYVRAR